jgi:hypothetical protein
MVSETLQLDAAGACLFSYLLKAEPDGYSDGLCRTYAHYASAHRTISRDPLFGIITIPISIESDGDGDDSFCGVATFDKSGTGATSIHQAVIWVSPKRQLRNATLAPYCSLIRLLAQLHKAAVPAHSVLRLWCDDLQDPPAYWLSSP